MAKRTLVTSALPYANGPIHLGHMAGAYLPADFYVRYKRLRQEDVVFICGSDEHGVPITIAADKEGVNPKDIVDRFHGRNKQIFEDFGISFDYYGRTTSPVHHKTSQDFFKTLYADGVFKKKIEEQLYDEQADMYLPDRYVKGTCPNCGYDEAYGDQCEKCGTSLSPTDLIDPVSAITGNKPITKATDHWYLPLGDFQERLDEWINGQDNWKPNVVGQCNSWLNQGLSDRAVTRDLTWGVPVPLEDTEGKVLYVWFDAPIGYISATKEWAEKQGQPDLWEKYWKDEDTDLVHFIGKDNIVFHCIMFPAMLMAHGEFILPKNVPANEFLNLEGRKLSTSRGWAVWLDEYLEDFDADLMRYVLGTILPEAKDSDFSWKDFQNKNNSELADILGNFINRTLSFATNFFDGKVPDLDEPSDKDLETLKQIESYRELIASKYEAFRFREVLLETMNLARLGNKYFTEMEPWKTRKEDKRVCGNTIHVCLQIAAALSVLFDPIMPQKMKELRNNLKLSEKPEWDDVQQHMLEVDHPVEQGEILFRKLEDEEVQKQLDRLKERSKEAQKGQEEAKEETVERDNSDYKKLKKNIEFDDFAKLDLRVAVIESAKPLENSNKLMELGVDLGFEKRTILAGIQKEYDAEQLVGKHVVVVANLAPKKMAGSVSEGMVLMAEDPDGNLAFLETDAEAGSQIS